jgi:hypothetical protein
MFEQIKARARELGFSLEKNNTKKYVLRRDGYTVMAVYNLQVVDGFLFGYAYGYNIGFEEGVKWGRSTATQSILES